MPVIVVDALIAVQAEDLRAALASYDTELGKTVNAPIWTHLAAGGNEH